MTLSSRLKLVERFILDNAPAIATAVGVTGTITTAVLTGKATYKAYVRIEQENIEQEMMNRPPLSRKESFKLVWPLYVPPVVVGAVTVTAIVGANRVGTKRAAALAAAYSLSEKTLAEYKERVVQTIGEKKEQRVHDEVVQKRVDNQPVGKREVILMDQNNVLCYDMLTGRYFSSNMETIRKAENDINRRIMMDNYCSVNDFHSLIGLAHTSLGDELGWNLDAVLELKFTSVLTDQNKPCLAIDYRVQPVRGYHRIH